MGWGGMHKLPRMHGAWAGAGHSLQHPCPLPFASSLISLPPHALAVCPAGSNMYFYPPESNNDPYCQCDPGFYRWVMGLGGKAAAKGPSPPPVIVKSAHRMPLTSHSVGQLGFALSHPRA